eukprot:CAMPEP_0185747984 /NCGR_PEP_ID=MMETSP1174-20130828/6635_1 /TAXON_ID=35687 /ORGANISM="Dictyocha speculum, Strain CCMP1381" /LENGTH=85 /DNA_ID=CAMNT_0028423431 /DNA_START=23 /DNA_END=278 /DNA_ORIENTATION=+
MAHAMAVIHDVTKASRDAVTTTDSEESHMRPPLPPLLDDTVETVTGDDGGSADNGVFLHNNKTSTVNQGVRQVTATYQSQSEPPS